MKRFFETPKKAAISVFCIFALIAVIGTGTVFAANVIAGNSLIGEANARKAAFEDNNKNNNDEEREADALQAESQSSQNINHSPQNVDQSQNNQEQISLETAKATVLADAGADISAVTFTKAKQEYEDGVSVYEIEFYTAENKYEYEINTVTGEICSKDIENRQKRHETGTNQNDASIGTEQAKSIAVSHAGFSDEDVIFREVKLEREDGLIEYEIEFYKDNTKYEYKINAENGTILEFDIEQE